MTFDEAKEILHRCYRGAGDPKPPFVTAFSMIGQGPFLCVTGIPERKNTKHYALRLGLEKDDPTGEKLDMSYCVRMRDESGREDWIGRTAHVLPIPEGAT